MQPFSWTESGALPAGLALSTSGQLTGTPTRAGTYSIVVTVADSSMPPLTAQSQVSIIINDSPIVVATSPAPPDGTVNQPYPAFGFAASGGSTPYSWRVTSGSLPPGLMLRSDGSISGIPATAGTYSFSVTATDSAQPPETTPALAVSVRTSLAPPAGLVHPDRLHDDPALRSCGNTAQYGEGVGDRRRARPSGCNCRVVRSRDGNIYRNGADD